MVELTKRMSKTGLGELLQVAPRAGPPDALGPEALPALSEVLGIAAQHQANCNAATSQIFRSSQISIKPRTNSVRQFFSIPHPLEYSTERFLLIMYNSENYFDDDTVGVALGLLILFCTLQFCCFGLELHAVFRLGPATALRRDKGLVSTAQIVVPFILAAHGIIFAFIFLVYDPRSNDRLADYDCGAKIDGDIGGLGIRIAVWVQLVVSILVSCLSTSHC